MSDRARLADRRVGFVIDFRREPIRALFTVTYALDARCRCAEVFLNCTPSQGDLEKNIRDAAILASLALQHGATLDALISSVTHEEDGAASSIIGTALMLVRDDIRRLDPPVGGLKRHRGPDGAEGASARPSGTGGVSGPASAAFSPRAGAAAVGHASGGAP